MIFWVLSVAAATKLGRLALERWQRRRAWLERDALDRLWARGQAHNADVEERWRDTWGNF